MDTRPLVAGLIALGVAAACGGDLPTSGTPTTTSITTTTVPPPTTTTTPSTLPATTTTLSACDETAVLATIGTWVERAGLSNDDRWTVDPTGTHFAGRTTGGAEFAERLGLDCGMVAGQTIGPDERLLITAWTGPRLAWVLQTTETPTTPYDPQATVTVGIDDTEGEYLDDRRWVWAGTFGSGDTFVVGHVDYNLGAAAKGWMAGSIPFDEDPVLASELHGFAVLEAAGMRNVGIAQPAEIGSEEGYVQFISPTGQISVADVAPTGWFDPLQPRYFSGPTRIERIKGVDVRITEPDPAERFAIGADLGFACNDFAWLLQPPANGDADEMLETAAAIIATTECRVG